MNPSKELIILMILLVLPFSYASYTQVFPKEILFFDRLNANEIQIKPVENSLIKITSVGVITNQNSTRSRIIVQAMPDCPEQAPYQTDLLQCFTVTQQNLNEKIEQIEIHFKVPKEWIESNNYAGVELRRYSYSWNENGKLSEWDSLITELEKQDSEFNYYISYSDGIEYFSIVGVKKEDIQNNYLEIKNEQNQKEASSEIKTNNEENNKVTETNQITGTTIIGSNAEKVPILFILLTIILTAGVTSAPFLSNRKHETHFDKLVNYLETHKSKEEALENLLDAGWESWQIELAFKEINERN